MIRVEKIVVHDVGEGGEKNHGLIRGALFSVFDEGLVLLQQLAEVTGTCPGQCRSESMR